MFVRPGELPLAIDFDKAIWVVPAATMKMNRPHRVPLARQAIVILHELQAESVRTIEGEALTLLRILDPKMIDIYG